MQAMADEQRSWPVRVLVAEDSPAAQQVIRRHLDMEGFDLTFVEDGREAVERATRHRYDLLVIDLRLPGLHGLDVIRMIRAFEIDAARQRAPIIVMSASSSVDDVRACKEAGADGHIAKPVNSSELLHAVVRHCLA